MSNHLPISDQMAGMKNSNVDVVLVTLYECSRTTVPHQYLVMHPKLVT